MLELLLLFSYCLFLLATTDNDIQRLCEEQTDMLDIIYCVCPAWASFHIKIWINLEGASPLWAGVTP